MEFLPSLITRLDPSTTPGFILTLALFSGVALLTWPKIRIKFLEAKDKIEESETAQYGRQMTAMQSELDYFKRNFEDLRQETRLLHDYAQYTMRSMRRVEIFLASKGIDFPPPPFKDYDQWVDGGPEE